MSDKPTPCLGQIWTYVTRGSSRPDLVDETIRLIAKNKIGSFEYTTLFGSRGRTECYTRQSIINIQPTGDSGWVYDPEAKGSQYWRDQENSK